MKFILGLIILLLVFTSSTAQQNKLKTWAVMKDLIDKETKAAETLIKSHGYKYDRSFEGQEVKFNEFTFGIRNNIYDYIVLGNIKGVIGFMKFEITNKEFVALVQSFNKDGLSKSKSGKAEEFRDIEYITQDKQIRIRCQLASVSNPNIWIVNIYNSTIPFCIPSISALDEFCPLITKRLMKEDEKGIQSYTYHDVFKKMSCAENTSNEIAVQKVGLFWNLYHNQFLCSINGFNLQSRNIIFYGIRMTFEDFLYDMITTYKIDINLKYFDKDESGNRLITALDFAKEELQKAKAEIPVSQDKVSSIQNIFKLLQKNGGKLSSEL